MHGVAAYEFATHAALTREAYFMSRLNPGSPDRPTGSDLRARLGLERQRDSLGVTYIDMAGGGAAERSAYPVDYDTFAVRRINEANTRAEVKPELPTLPAWLMLGAIREDDVTLDGGEIENTPQDDPLGAFSRVLNHFYDPYRDWPLRLMGPGVDVGSRAPDWAIRGTPGPNARTNSFSIVMGREALWRALTLKKAPPSPGWSGPLSDLAFVPTTRISTQEQLRIAYWATVFRALGGAVHLLQDMAQPQHTRNDPHAGLGCGYGKCVLGHASYYEAYVDARVKDRNSFRLTDRFLRTTKLDGISERISPRAPKYEGYAVVRLPDFDSYYVTARLGASATGKGLANYSNQGFYSAATVVGSPYAGQYVLPPPRLEDLIEDTIPSAAVINAAGETINSGALKLFRARVMDSMRPEHTAISVPLASQGAFDQFLNPTILRHTTLNHYNYAAQAELLLPRAVAYSAGLLDYFFRGMLEIGLPDEGVYAARDVQPGACTTDCGFTGVKLKLTNATPEEAMGPGVMVAVVKFHRNTCYRSDLSGEPGGPGFVGNGCRNPEEEIVVSAARAIGVQATGTTQTLTFDFGAKPIPLNATDVSLQVVFRGKLGNEDDAVAVTTRNVAEPTYLALENATDYRYDSATKSYSPSGAPVAFSNAKVQFGDGTKTIATLGTLPAPGHAQFAFLGDNVDTPVRIEFGAPSLVGGQPLTALLPPFRFYLPPGTGTTYASTWPVAPVRGVYRRFVYSVSLKPGYDVYLCTQDFNPLACSEAALPALTAATAVAWTIRLE